VFIDTIAEWRDQAFHSPLLNRIWQLLPGFILWQIWKERNRRVFRNLSQPWQSCWHQCRNHILETISLQQWTDDTGGSTPSELLILQHWQPLPSSPPLTPSPPPLHSSSPSSWSPPSFPFIKLTPDGVALRSTWQAMGEGTRSRGTPPRDGRVLQPTTLPIV
jgi:hypothetical protein